MSELINGRTPDEIRTALILNSDLNNDALRLIYRLESERDAAQAKAPKWISVKDRLPENPGRYGVYAFGQILALDFDENEYWWDDEYNLYNGGVTHWMPLPEPPKEDAHER